MTGVMTARDDTAVAVVVAAVAAAMMPVLGPAWLMAWKNLIPDEGLPLVLYIDVPGGSGVGGSPGLLLRPQPLEGAW